MGINLPHLVQREPRIFLGMADRFDGIAGALDAIALDIKPPIETRFQQIEKSGLALQGGFSLILRASRPCHSTSLDAQFSCEAFRRIPKGNRC